jgi:hypothetical protein
MSFNRDDVQDFVQISVVLLLVVGAPIVLIVGGAMWIASASCYSQLELNKLEGIWGPLVDCQVKTEDGYYIPYAQYRAFENVKLKRKE